MMPPAPDSTTQQPASLEIGQWGTIGEMFVRAFERNGDRVAIDDTDERLTYRELGARVGAFADVLRAAGLKRGQALAQLSSNRIDAVCTIAAAFLLGLRYTPLHPLGSEPDQVFILDDAEIDCLVFDDRRFGERAQKLAAQTRRPLVVFSHRDLVTEQSAACADAGTSHALQCDAHSGDIALIAYTGGTTGRPKGVVHRSRSLMANLLIAMAEWDWGEPCRFLAVTPISHAAFLFILPVFLRGGTFFMLPSFTAGEFAEAVKANGITATFLVPTMIYALLDQMSELSNLASLQSIVYGAAPISPSRMQEAIVRMGPKFSQLYGQTEAPNAVTMLFKRDHDLERPERLQSCGVALTGNDIKLLDSDGHTVAPGMPGEICVRGPLVMDGYWKRPEETAEALAGGWLHTGDIARQDADGFYFIMDRKKDVVISGGFNVFPSEIEGVMCGHPAVAQCCVVGVPDDKWGEAVAAFVVLRSGATVHADELRSLVRREKGTVYTPKVVHIREHLPLTPLGKIDRKAIRAEFWSSTARQVN